jgi:hypothetical protein
MNQDGDPATSDKPVTADEQLDELLERTRASVLQALENDPGVQARMEETLRIIKEKGTIV